jgi:RHS repeat-associated protein
MAFSLGKGWQTPTQSGQAHYPDELASVCVDVWPEGGHSHQIYDALLDLNGDGINDYYAGWWGPGTAWLGLGDGTYLTLNNQSTGIMYPMGADGLVRGSDPLILWECEYGVLEPVRDQMQRTETIDMNGDGLLDRVEFEVDLYATGSGHYSVWFQRGPSGLLETVTNELGGVTRFEYQPSNWVNYKQERPADTNGEGLPETHPPSVVRSSSPQWVLTKITVEDGRTGTPSQEQAIDYAGLRYDYESREYLGARMAETVDDPDGASFRTRRFFHQTDPLRPRLEFEEIEDETGALVHTEKADWFGNTTVNESGNDVLGSYFPEPRTTTASLIDPVTGEKQIRVVEREFDAQTGNLTKSTDWGPDEALGGADDYVENFFYVPTVPGPEEDWLVSYPDARFETVGGVDGKMEMFAYDHGISGAAPIEGLLTQRVTTQSAADPAVWEKWDYDDFGNQTEYFDGRAVDAGDPVPTRLTAYDFEFETFPTSITNSLGHVTQYAFNTDFGEVSKVFDPNGYLRCWTYDVHGRLEARKNGTPGTTLEDSCTMRTADFVYPWIGNPTQQHALETQYAWSGNIRSRRFIDGLGRVYQEEREQTEGTFAITVRGWGPRGELSCESLPIAGSGGAPYECEAVASETTPAIKTTYDALLRPLDTARAVDLGAGQIEISRMYSIADLDGMPGNELIETRTVLGSPSPDRIVKVGTDARKNVVAVDESPTGGLTVLERDAKGRVVQVDGPDVTLDGGGGSDPNELTIAYNHVDQRVSLSGLWPASAEWVYSYDLNGNLYEQASPAGTKVRFHWDKLNRLAVKDYEPLGDIGNAGPQDVLYTYDTAENGIGRLASVENPGPTAVDTSFSYTRKGKIETMVRNFGSNGAFPFIYGYDLLGRRTLTVLPNTIGIVHHYNGSVLEKIEERIWRNRRKPPINLTVADNVQLHASGAIAQIDYPLVSGRSTYTYDSATHRLDTAQGNFDGDTVQDLDFDYDRAGNLTDVYTLGTVTEFDQSFTYDGLHRLWTATSSGPHSCGSRSYSYDAAGNLRTKGELTLLYEGSANAGPHAVTRVQASGAPDAIYQYDVDGGLVVRTKDRITLDLTRDADGRVTGLSGAAGGTYVYDEAGQRSRKTISGGADILYVDPIFEVDLSDSTHRVHFFHGARRVATERRSGLGLPTDRGEDQSWQYYFPDFVGSNAVVARETDTVMVQESFFTPFGEFEQTGGGLSDYLFTDQENDPESGLQYFGARYYDPWVGRFMSQDPALIGNEAGITFGLIAGDPQQFNVYNYARNAPTVYVDPTGEVAVVVACAASPACRGSAAGAGGFVVGTLVNAAAQKITTGEVNWGDALTAGAAAGAVAATLAVNPAGIAEKAAWISAVGGTAGAAGSVGGDLVNDREVDVPKATVATVASAVAAPFGAGVGNAAENVLGAPASSIVGEIAGATAGEITGQTLSVVAPEVAESIRDAGGATAEGTRGVARDVQQGHQPLHDRGSITCTKTVC